MNLEQTTIMSFISAIGLIFFIVFDYVEFNNLESKIEELNNQVKNLKKNKKTF